MVNWRGSKTLHFFGKMYDGVVDSVIEIGFSLAMELHFYLVVGEPFGFVIGTVAAFSHAMTQLLMLRYRLMSVKYRSAGAPMVALHPSLERLTGQVGDARSSQSLALSSGNRVSRYRAQSVAIAELVNMRKSSINRLPRATTRSLAHQS